MRPMSNHRSDVLLTIGEVSRLLGLRPGTVRLWLRRRQLPSVKCGRFVRVSKVAVDHFIEENTVQVKGGHEI